MSSSSISLTVSHRGTIHALTCLPDSTLASLQARLEELTLVPPSLQKLLYKGKNSKASQDHQVTLAQAGFRDGMKVQLLGSTAEELGVLKAAEDQQRKRDRILQQRALKSPTKVSALLIARKVTQQRGMSGAINSIPEQCIQQLQIPSTTTPLAPSRPSVCSCSPHPPVRRPSSSPYYAETPIFCRCPHGTRPTRTSRVTGFEC
jgi:hypothetical protein